MFALANKVAIVTGASSGIGRATAKLIAEEGAKVVVAALREAELDTLVAEIEDLYERMTFCMASQFTSISEPGSISLFLDDLTTNENTKTTTNNIDV